jgi:hypothetical protein
VDDTREVQLILEPPQHLSAAVGAPRPVEADRYRLPRPEDIADLRAPRGEAFPARRQAAGQLALGIAASAPDALEQELGPEKAAVFRALHGVHPAAPGLDFDEVYYPEE